MEFLKHLPEALSAVPPSTYCQTFFLLATTVVLSLHLLPNEARNTISSYGARRSETAPPQSNTLSLLRKVTSIGQVPHSFFWHFYLLSTCLSALWAWQYLGRGPGMAFIAGKQVLLNEPSVELGRVFLAWMMMALQGGRRLYECFWVVKPGKTPMWFVHWALGLAFYAVMSVSVWVEGSGAILESWENPKAAVLLSSRVPSTLAVFFAAWIKQNECHRHLASLKKYTLPSEGMFKYIVCPHYTCECAIYLAISYMAAPPGKTFNMSVLCGLALVVANLGSTAHGTKQWYAGKFGAEKVSNKWSMIPGIF